MIKYVCDRCKKEFVRNNRGDDNWFLICPECASKFNKIAYFFMVKTRIQIAGQDEVID